jgi:hypothetical protein
MRDTAAATVSPRIRQEHNAPPALGTGPIGRHLQSALSRDATPDGWKLVLTRKQVPENGVLLRVLTGRRRAQCRSAGVAGVPDLSVRDRDSLVVCGHSCEFDA